MIRGLKGSVICNYDMGGYKPGVLYLGPLIAYLITPCNTIGGTRPYLNSNYVSMTHHMGAIISLELCNSQVMYCITSV